MLNNKPHHYALQLTTLTPTSIGTGDTLSSAIDYEFTPQNKRLRFVNKSVLEKVLVEKDLTDALIRDMLTVKRDKNNKEIPFNIAFFLKDNRVAFDTVLEKKFYDVKGGSAIRFRQLYTILKNAGKPYIAGSSIKGAIETAILYDWLTTHEEGKQQLAELILK
jgi:CRISPR-associated protein Csm5